MPEPENIDVLQNLEATIANIWRANPTMTDYVAQRAYDAAFQHYRAEHRGHTPKPHGLTGLDATAFDAVHAVCEWRLGRASSPGSGDGDVAAITLDKMLDCLRELIKSVKRHTSLGGRQSYLTFIDGFVR